ncbi:MAG: glycoside hydrolase family 55 protein, partial [Candidatus Dormibacteraeota bacterium]|nr:glycoside hydrolase family 55 protein [Candidatus Dormibacteraeota bacterium]
MGDPGGISGPNRPPRRAFLGRAVLLSVGIAAPGLASLLMNPQVAARADDAVNTILNRRRPIFNVRDAAFGARGDGVADDRPAIQAAIDAAALAGGGLVYLPAGVYWLRSVRVQAGVRFYLLNYYSGVVLAGAGIDRTILRAAAGLPDQTRIISSNSSDGLSLVRNATFRDFTIDGVAAQQPN